MDNSPKTQPQVVLNMYEFFLLLNIFWRMQVNKQLMVVIYFHSMEKKNTLEVNGYRQLFGYQHSSKYRLVCSKEERNLYMFGTTWGWVNDDSIYIFGWIILLSFEHRGTAAEYIIGLRKINLIQMENDYFSQHTNRYFLFVLNLNSLLLYFVLFCFIFSEAILDRFPSQETVSWFKTIFLHGRQ